MLIVISGFIYVPAEYTAMITIHKLLFTLAGHTFMITAILVSEAIRLMLVTSHWPESQWSVVDMIMIIMRISIGRKYSLICLHLIQKKNINEEFNRIILKSFIQD